MEPGVIVIALTLCFAFAIVLANEVHSSSGNEGRDRANRVQRGYEIVPAQAVHNPPLPSSQLSLRAQEIYSAPIQSTLWLTYPPLAPAAMLPFPPYGADVMDPSFWGTWSQSAAGPGQTSSEAESYNPLSRADYRSKSPLSSGSGSPPLPGAPPPSQLVPRSRVENDEC
jgi:hypothetical protein